MDVDAPYDYQMKLLLVGDTSVGKTSLLLRFTEDNFRSVFISTIGIDFKVKTIEMDGLRIRLQIWDTAGQERYKSIAASYYRAAMGVLFVYDITSKKSYASIQGWLKDTSSKTDATPVAKVLVGNKSDMDSQRAVDKQTAEQFAAERSMQFFETSAKDGSNVREVFMSLAREIKKTRVDPLGVKKSGVAGGSSNTSVGGGSSGVIDLNKPTAAQETAASKGESGCAC